MDQTASPENETLDYPFAERPEAGKAIEVAPGVHWVRMALPWRLDHVHCWLLEDGGGWTVIDTGIDIADHRKWWEELFAGTMGGRPVKRVIGTHMHPDHVGLAGWLCERFGARLNMSIGEYQVARSMWHEFGRDEIAARELLYHQLGAPESSIERFRDSRDGYRGAVTELPAIYHRIYDRDTIEIGGREWRAFFGYGHSMEHVALYCDELKVLISGDQVLPRITSHVSVWGEDPDNNPLQHFMDSVEAFRVLPGDTLVLPSHGPIFRGLERRIGQILEHHEARCEMALERLKDGPKRPLEIVPALFHRDLDDESLFFALGETVAHLHVLLGRKQIIRETGADGVFTYRLAD
jgi:glyoxylase-like metal-dependent hydrolase (beta-lactamase superfamily II)